MPRAGISAATELRPAAGAAVTVVLAADRYPAGVDRGAVITGLDAAEAAGALVVPCGHRAERRARSSRTEGGSSGSPAAATRSDAARTAAYEAVGLVAFRGMRYRSDIAEAAADIATG